MESQPASTYYVHALVAILVVNSRQNTDFDLQQFSSSSTVSSGTVANLGTMSGHERLRPKKRRLADEFEGSGYDLVRLLPGRTTLEFAGKFTLGFPVVFPTFRLEMIL